MCQNKKECFKRPQWLRALHKPYRSSQSDYRHVPIVLLREPMSIIMQQNGHKRIDFHYGTVVRGLVQHVDSEIVLSRGLTVFVPLNLWDTRIVALVQEEASPSGGKIKKKLNDDAGKDGLFQFILRPWTDFILSRLIRCFKLQHNFCSNHKPTILALLSLGKQVIAFIQTITERK